MKETRKYIAEIVKEDYKNWKNEKIILNAGTGTGKTTFTLKILAPYFLKQGKKVLYLCNRKELQKEIEKEVKELKLLDTTVMSYQKLQKLLRKNYALSYDLIIADECHYFYTDAKFNEFTDLSYEFVMNQSSSVVVLMSATADSLFNDLTDDGEVSKDRVYKLAKSYDYVERVYTYKKDQLTNIIDYILADNDFEKILVFVNSISRLIEMHDYYGESAYYMCSKSQLCKFATNECIQDKQFDKRILFTTKVLDNGIDLIDTDLSHIISEIFDIDCTLQAIGRKRPIDALDTCNFYFRSYDGRAINNFGSANQGQLEPVQRYLNDKDEYFQYLIAHNINTRQLVRSNKIFCHDLRTKKLKINPCALKKYRLDKRTIDEMKDSSYEQVLFSRLGSDLASKKAELNIDTTSKDVFLGILESLEGQKLFKDQQKILKEQFKNILGLKDRTMGINTLNGKLVDCNYNYEIKSKRELSRKSDNFKKRYWIVERI